MSYAKGKTFEEIEIGDSDSFSKTISESDVYLFAGLSGDFNPMHVNADYAQTTPFKKRIAHGPLTQSLIAPVLGTKIPGLGTIALEIRTRFRSPTFIGDTITAIATVTEKLPEKKWIRLALSWTNQKGELVAEGEVLVMPPV